jgi:hypothetical protein
LERPSFTGWLMVNGFDITCILDGVDVSVEQSRAL